MKKPTKATLAAFGIVSLFSGCGGGSSGGLSGNDGLTRNASLDTTDDAARTFAALALGFSLRDQSAILNAAQSGSACNQNNGSRTFNNFSTTFVDVTFVNCDTRVTEGGDIIDVLLDGRVRAQCNSGSLQNCADLTATLGEGSSPLFADVEITEGGVRTVDAITNSVGTVRLVDTSTETRDSSQTILFLTATVDDQLNNRSFSVTTDNLELTLSENNNDGASTTSVSGALSLSGLSNCLTGGVDIATDSPITTNTNGGISSGQISFDNNEGQTAIVEFLSDDTFDITANGSTQNYSESQIEAFCN